MPGGCVEGMCFQTLGWDLLDGERHFRAIHRNQRVMEKGALFKIVRAPQMTSGTTHGQVRYIVIGGMDEDVDMSADHATDSELLCDLVERKVAILQFRQ